MDGRRSTTEIVADVLRDAIVTGMLQAGEVLNQVELARQFGVSRVPVREALRRLEAEGLVVSPPHRRTVVAALTPSLLDEIFDVRIVLETMVLAAAVPRLRAEDLAALEGLVAAMDREGDHRRWMRLDDQFHDALYRPSGKEFVCRLIGQLRRQVARHFWAGGRRVHRNREANAQHRRLLAAARAGDVARAQDELRRHLSRTHASLAAALRVPRRREA
jgi:DNA-binding GntR family transcriptional regulator